MRFTILVLCFTYTLVSSINAQTDSLNFYVNENLNAVLKDDASFYATAVKNLKTDTVWTVTIKYLNNNVVALQGFFYDTSFLKPEGLVSMYNNNGVKTTEGTYHNSKQNGLWLGWYDSGDIMDSSYFFNDNIIVNTHYNYYNREISDRVYTNNNTKEKVLYTYSNGKLSSEMSYFNGTEHEISRSYYPNGNLKYESSSQKQKITDEKFYSEDGASISKKEYEKILKDAEANQPKLIEPEFPGGMTKFIGYITYALKRSHSIQDQISYVKEISIIFSLDAEGKPYNVKLLPEESIDITSTIINIMKYMPKWKMNGLVHANMQRTIKLIF